MNCCEFEAMLAVLLSQKKKKKNKRKKACDLFLFITRDKQEVFLDVQDILK